MKVCFVNLTNLNSSHGLDTNRISDGSPLKGDELVSGVAPSAMAEVKHYKSLE